MGLSVLAQPSFIHIRAQSSMGNPVVSNCWSSLSGNGTASLSLNNITMLRSDKRERLLSCYSDTARGNYFQLFICNQSKTNVTLDTSLARQTRIIDA